MPRSVRLSTDQIEPNLRDEFWRDISRPLFEVELLNGEDDALRGAFSSRPVAGLTVATTRFNAQRYRRDRRTIVESGLDTYLVQVLVAGTLRGDCEGRTITAATGDICIFDLARPYVTHADAGARVAISVPRVRIDQAVGRRNLHGLVLAATDPMARLLRGFIVDLHEVGGDLDGDDARAAETAMIEVLAAVVSRRRLDLPDAQGPLAQRLRERIEAYLDTQLTNPDLCVELILQEFQVSRAHLYRMFADDGGVASVIRNRRLDTAFHRLRTADAAGTSISEIAFELGFSSSAQFTRAFRARFDLSPSDAKQGSAGGSAEPGSVHGLQAHLANQVERWREHP
ncbi:transcriptional regulator, AraC family [Sphingomonas laterariae]|uniref:Transcriptional regulator, AraC family n=1 Tax=Edaphosphingomonas laterariae TaxID=861865 RepID=A0A239J657_9SPHN|nr:helix-turn-helix domain-containing protein [Sphingomonas laterariae]SNT00968.1 transcriptional regulator, AraC family [Sphingomonas laterariae]